MASSGCITLGDVLAIQLVIDCPVQFVSAVIMLQTLRNARVDHDSVKGF